MSRWWSALRATHPAGVITGVFVLLAVCYSAATPAFEPPDEASHFLYIHNMLVSGELPVLEDKDTVYASQSVQRHHPPLYYLTGALLILPTQRTDINAYLQINPLGTSGVVTANNQNVHLHPLNASGDTQLAIWIVRLFSITLACGTLYCVYKTGALVSGKEALGLLAMLLVAMMPTFLFISASINNDNLVTFLYAAGIYWTARIWHSGKITRRDSLLLGLILAGIALAKINGLTLFGFVYGWLMLGVLIKRLHWRDVLLAIGLSLVMAALLAGWWYLRNSQLYGDPLAMVATRRIWGRGPFPTDPDLLLSEAKGVWDSFWMTLGHFNIRGPAWLYPYVTVISLIGTFGLLIAFIQDRARRGLYLMLLSGTALVTVTLIITTQQVNVSQGRILFPALAAFAPLIVIGWCKLLTRQFALLLMAPLIGMALITPFTILPAAYAYPARVESVPEDARRIDAAAEGLSLLAYHLETDLVYPDDTLTVWAYIQGTHAENPLLFAKLIDPYSGVPVGGIDAYPGMARTAEFDPAVIYRVPLHIPLQRDLLTGSEPRQLSLVWGWRVPEPDNVGEGHTLTWIDASGQSIEQVSVPGLTLIDPAYTVIAPEHTSEAVFADSIRLVGYDVSAWEISPGESLSVRLVWHSVKPLDGDWMVTAALLGEDGQLLAQDDGPVRGYPTSAWHEGPDFPDYRTLTPPEDAALGEYRLYVGWYRLSDFTRLPVSGEGTDPAASLYFMPQTVRLAP